MNVTVIQPPLVQLNTPYPSGAYLSAFFRTLGHEVKWNDLSIELFNGIFSKEGMELLFQKSTEAALKKSEEFLKSGDRTSAETIKNYIVQSQRWTDWMDSIVAILRDGGKSSGRELCHRFLFSPYAPRGSRMNRFLEELDHEPSVDDARFLACMALADIADYIAVVFDNEFSLIRYAESLTVSETSFSQIEKGVDSPILCTFFEPILQRFYGAGSEFESKIKLLEEGQVHLVCISIPFAGTFAAGLYAGRFLKKLYGSKVFVCFGGGFVNTELRESRDASLCNYADALSYDRGYGSYKALFDCSFNKKIPCYKMRFFSPDEVTDPKEEDKEAVLFEDKMTSTIVPDYSDIDFSLYPRMTDDTNPMQRMWSDGSWIKAYLAHGCYWHKCDFCDVTLDYVSGYRLTRIDNLYAGLVKQCRQKGIYGLHFVDEALPPVALTQFAALNAADGNQLSYWGNVRFEKTFSHDLAAFLAYGGLIGVSAGIEIATGTGLDSIHKGTDLDSIVAACCAFKEAGILVHSYMIYGYWMEKDQDMINSMETLRQFYAAGLLDSSFWHKFMLTRHSRIYDEWKKGLHPNLVPLESKDAGLFAKNCMHFKGEEKSQKFGPGLNAALQAWMHGQSLNRSVTKWFDFPVPKPTIPQDYIEKAIQNYEERKQREQNAELKLEKLYWLGGMPVVSRGKLSFMNMEEMETVACNLGSLSQSFALALYDLRPELHDVSKMKSLMEQDAGVGKVLKELRTMSLVQLPF